MRVVGSTLLRGMWITLGQFCETYVEDFKILTGIKKRPKVVRQGPESAGVFTVQYPEQKLQVTERFRVLPVLIQEEKDKKIRCTSCGICAKVCPPQCIWILQAKDPKTGKAIPQPENFWIDTDVCMNCGLCSEFCPFDAIKMDQRFELSDYDRKDAHIHDLNRLLVSTDYYAKTHPLAWAEEKAKLEAKAAKAKAAAAAAAAKRAAAQAAAPPESAGNQP